MKAMHCKLRDLFQLYIGTMKSTVEWRKALDSNDVFFIETVRTEANLVRIMVFSILVFLVQISNIVFDIATNAHPQYAAEYLTICIVLMAICTVYFFAILYLLTRYEQRDGLGCKKVVYMSFWIAISVAMLYLCFLDLMEKDALTNYLTLLASLGVMSVLDVKEFFSILAFDLIGEIAIITLLEKKAYLLQHCIGITVCAAIVARSLFHSYVLSKTHQRKLKLYAETDPLTGLPNRRGMEEWIRAHRADCIKRRCRIAVGIIDVDDFKEYNDEFGHLEGDECLKYIADCISKAFIKKEGIVTRFGGEEFVVVFKDATEEDAISLFEEVKLSIENKKDSPDENGKCKSVTVSIGVTCERFDDDSCFEQIFERADNALYRAKKRGKNVVILDNAEDACK